MDHDLYRRRTIGEAPFYRWPGGEEPGGVVLHTPRTASAFTVRPRLQALAGAPQWQPFDYREWTWRKTTGIGAESGGCCASSKAPASGRRFPSTRTWRGGSLSSSVTCSKFELELMAHGVAANVVHHDAMTPADEASLIDECLSTLASHSVRCRGWLSPGFSESLRTADLLRERGLTYVGDWVNDDTPYRFTNGLVSLPGGYDTSDLNVVWDGARSARDWSEQVMAMLGFLAEEAAAEGPRVACVMVHPWLTGQPHRVDSFRRVVDFAAGLDSCWRATGAEIAGHAQAELPTVDGAVEG